MCLPCIACSVTVHTHTPHARSYNIMNARIIALCEYASEPFWCCRINYVLSICLCKHTSACRRLCVCVVFSKHFRARTSRPHVMHNYGVFPFVFAHNAHTQKHTPLRARMMVIRVNSRCRLLRWLSPSDLLAVGVIFSTPDVTRIQHAHTYAYTRVYMRGMSGECGHICVRLVVVDGIRVAAIYVLLNMLV